MVGPTRTSGHRLGDPPTDRKEVTNMEEIEIRKLDKIETTNDCGNSS